MCQEYEVIRSRQSKVDWSSVIIDDISLKTMIEIIAKAYEVKKLKICEMPPSPDF